MVFSFSLSCLYSQITSQVWTSLDVSGLFMSSLSLYTGHCPDVVLPRLTEQASV